MQDLESWLERVYDSGGDHSQLKILYDEWASDYDRQLWASGNPYIAIATGFVGRHIDNFDANILDAGCGTGNMAQILQQMGYRSIDGLDPSEGMLEIARTKNIYKSLHRLYLDSDIDIDDASYDAVVADAMKSCVELAYQQYIAVIGKIPGPMLDDYTRVVLQHRAFVGEFDQHIVGILVLIKQVDGILLDNVAVNPVYQGKGFGKKLVDFAEAEAVRQGFSSLELYTHELMTANYTTYLRLGYEEIDRREEKGFARIYMKKNLGICRTWVSQSSKQSPDVLKRLLPVPPVTSPGSKTYRLRRRYWRPH